MDHLEHRLIRMPELLHMVGIKRSTVFLWIKMGKFPPQRKLSTKTSVWVHADIIAFIKGEWKA